MPASGSARARTLRVCSNRKWKRTLRAGASGARTLPGVKQQPLEVTRGHPAVRSPASAGSEAARREVMVVNAGTEINQTQSGAIIAASGNIVFLIYLYITYII